MKAILTTTILAASLAFARGAVGDNKTLTEKTREAGTALVDTTKEVVHDTKEAASNVADSVSDATRATWIKTKGYLSEDPVVFREGATLTLNELAKEITVLMTNHSASSPDYFKTRLVALDMQHKQLSMNLAKLTPEQIKVRMSGERYTFDQSVESLEEAIDQAQKEAKRFMKRENA